MEIGTDIVEHARINLKIAKKVLAVAELNQFNKLITENQKIEYLASRIAGKEAIIKASNLKYTFKDIEIIRTEGKSIVNIDNIKLSIAHEKEYSIAFCLIE